jgi:RNA polymerase sigma factor (sigma-70 family)
LDARAIDGIYRRHGAAVMRRARFLLGSEDDAREMLNEIFVSLLDRPEQFAEKSSITTWLYSATTHGCLNRLRNERTRRRILQEKAMPPSESSSESPEHAAMLRQELTRLPNELAEVAVYHYLDGMTHDEIASVVGCSRRHVGDLIERMHAQVNEETSS